MERGRGYLFWVGGELNYVCVLCCMGFVDTHASSRGRLQFVVVAISGCQSRLR